MQLLLHLSMATSALGLAMTATYYTPSTPSISTSTSSRSVELASESVCPAPGTTSSSHHGMLSPPSSSSTSNVKELAPREGTTTMSTSSHTGWKIIPTLPPHTEVIIEPSWPAWVHDDYRDTHDE